MLIKGNSKRLKDGYGLIAYFFLSFPFMHLVIYRSLGSLYEIQYFFKLIEEENK